MPTNPFFNFSQSSRTDARRRPGCRSNSNLRTLRFYIPRDAVDMDRLFGEDELAKYTNAQEIELYVKSSVQLGGQSLLLSKFGLHEEDQITFLVSSAAFTRPFRIRPTP
jgi:hypothetical protein